MAKPVSPLPTWASNAVWATGPKAGNATKITIPAGVAADGHRPGVTAPTAAQHDNDWRNQVSAWCDWLDEGVATNDESAHLVETDSTGEIHVAYARLGSSVLDGTPLVVRPLPAGSAIGIDVQGTGIRSGVLARGGDTAGAALEGVQSAAGNSDPAVLGRHQQGGRGVEGRGDGTAAGVYGLADQSGGNARGVEGLGGDIGGAGVYGTGQTVGEAGVEGINTATGGRGVIGRSAAAATSLAAAVLGLTGTGDATGIDGNASAGDGYGARSFADTSSPVRAAHRFVPQDAFPSGTPGDGDFMVHSGLQTVVAHIRGNSLWRALMTNQKGFAWAIGTDATAANNNNVTYTDGAIAVMGAAGQNAASQTGDVWVLAFGGFRNTAGTLQGVDVRIRDVTAGADVLAAEILEVMPTGTGGVEHNWSRLASYPLPSVGVSRDLRVQFRKTGGAGTGITLDNSGLLVLGVF